MHASPQRVPDEEPGPTLFLLEAPADSTLTPLVLRFFKLMGRSIWRAFQHDAFAIAKASAYLSILTFFPWEHAAPGRGGLGLTQTTAFAVPATSIGFWTHRLVEKGVKHDAPVRQFGETVLSFSDPDGMSLALVGVAGAESQSAWAGDYMVRQVNENPMTAVLIAAATGYMLAYMIHSRQA